MSEQNFQEVEPYWTGPDAVLYQGDVRACLRRMPARSVQCVVTSPPYWGLRDYGTGRLQIGLEEKHDCLGWATGDRCASCYVCAMVGVFAEVRRVLRDDGTVWLNLGDSYGSGSNLTGVPWRTALALQADGWILRQDIIWAKPNPMPESVMNRCTKSHEYIFLLAKNQEYYYDAVAVSEESLSPWNSKKHFGAPRKKSLRLTPQEKNRQRTQYADNTNHPDVEQSTKNKRDVWTVSAQGYPGAHYATFSGNLITPCILAGTSEYGSCMKCGAPYRRVATDVSSAASYEQHPPRKRDRSFEWSRNGIHDSHSTLDGIIAVRETVGWRKACGCQTDDVVPCVVLDPFVGSGTTVATALSLGRAGIGIDLSETYLYEHAVPRIEDVLWGENPSYSQAGRDRRSGIVCHLGTPPTARALRAK